MNIYQIAEAFKRKGELDRKHRALPIQYELKDLTMKKQMEHMEQQVISSVPLVESAVELPKDFISFKDISVINSAGEVSPIIPDNRTESEKYAHKAWEIINNDFRNKGGVNPHAYLLGFKDGETYQKQKSEAREKELLGVIGELVEQFERVEPRYSKDNAIIEKAKQYLK